MDQLKTPLSVPGRRVGGSGGRRSSGGGVGGRLTANVRSALVVLTATLALVLLAHSHIGHTAADRAVRQLGLLAAVGAGDDALLPEYVGEERLLRTLTEECARGEDTVISLGEGGGVVVERHINTT